MQSKQINDAPLTYALVLESGEEAVAAITNFAVERRLDATQLSAIGAFSRVTLGFFEPDRRDYRHNRLDEQVEVVGRADGTAWGGHLVEGIVCPTLEVILTESPGHLHRVFDPATGLPLIRTK